MFTVGLHRTLGLGDVSDMWCARNNAGTLQWIDGISAIPLKSRFDDRTIGLREAYNDAGMQGRTFCGGAPAYYIPEVEGLMMLIADVLHNVSFLYHRLDSNQGPSH